MAEIKLLIGWKKLNLYLLIFLKISCGTAYDKEGNSISDETMQVADRDAVLFGVEALNGIT